VNKKQTSEINYASLICIVSFEVAAVQRTTASSWHQGWNA